MAPIEWRPEFSVGDPAIDHEHRELIDLVNRAADAINRRAPSTDIEDDFGDLLRTISAHFALEERQMRAASYDGFSEHKADHERLLDVLRDIMDSAADGPDPVSDRLVSSLEVWFANHFQSHDSRLHRRLGPQRHR